jgi:hypothetical protein
VFVVLVSHVGSWLIASRRRRAPVLVARDEVALALIGAGLVLLVAVVPHSITADGRVRFDALTRLLELGYLSRSAHSLVGPLFSAPLYYAGKLALGSAWWCERFNALVFAAGITAVYALLKRDVEPGILFTFFLVLIAASMFPNHVQDYFGEPFTTMAVAVGAAALSTGRTLAGWTALVLGVVNTPAALLGLLFVAIVHACDTRRLRHLLPVAAAGILIAAEAWVRRGGPFVTGYETNAGALTVLPYSGRPGFSYPFFFGVLSILFSFGKGLLFFAPGLLLPLRTKDADVPAPLGCCYRLWIAFVIGLVAVYARWWAWYGGWTWGPRFFLAASLPASLAIAAALHNVRSATMPRLIGLLAILVLACWVAIDGAVFRQANLSLCRQKHYALELLCWYTPEFSALWHPFVEPARLNARDWVFVLYAVTVFAFLAQAPVSRMITIVRQSAAPNSVAAAIRSFRF